MLGPRSAEEFVGRVQARSLESLSFQKFGG